MDSALTTYSSPSFGYETIFAWIELDEKPRRMAVLSNLIDVEPEDVYIGMPVEVVFEPIPGHEMTLYEFRPVAVGNSDGSVGYQ